MLTLSATHRFVLIFALLSTAPPALADPEVLEQAAPPPLVFDYGFGPNVNVGDRHDAFWNRVLRKLWSRSRTPIQTEAEIRAAPAPLGVAPPLSSVSVSVGGSFGPLLPWPIVPLHMALLPDGRVMSYGTDQRGRQTGLLYYDLWNPTAPYPQSHTVLPNTTGTDLFCSGLGLLPNGSLLLTGGDLTVQGLRNYANADVNAFTPSTNTLTRVGTMSYPRWYPSIVPLPSGDSVVMGGRSNYTNPSPVQTPEYYSFGQNMFTTLPGATLPTRFTWYYPRAYVMSDGNPLLLNINGELARLTLSGQGAYQVFPQRAAPSTPYQPSVMDGPGRILSLRQLLTSDGVQATYQFESIDASKTTPVVTELASPPGAGRVWSNLTVLADGSAFLNGGSVTSNLLSMVSYQSALYNPNTNVWTPGPTNGTPRLYHSASLLLPDATVLTGGGGAPGPILELNAEIYYPPYLYNSDGSNTFATRPVIASAPSTVIAGTTFGLTMADATPIGAVNLVRIGALTHSANVQSRFLTAAFSQNGNVLTVNAPANANDFLTGYWMVFALNANGVPSVAKIVYAPPSSSPQH